MTPQARRQMATCYVIIFCFMMINKLEVKDDGISTQKIEDSAVIDSKILSMNASKLFGTVTANVDNVNTTTQNLTLLD